MNNITTKLKTMELKKIECESNKLTGFGSLAQIVRYNENTIIKVFDGITTYDISDPLNIKQTGYFNHEIMNHVRKVCGLYDNKLYCYCYGSEKISLFDISDVNNIRLQKTVDVDGVIVKNATITKDGVVYAFVKDGSIGTIGMDGHFTKLAVLEEYDDSSWCNALGVFDDLLILSYWGSNLFIYEIQNDGGLKLLKDVSYMGSEFAYGFPMNKIFLALDNNFILQMKTHVLLIDIRNREKIALTEMITIKDTHINTNYICYYKENEIMVSGSTYDNHFAVFLIKLTEDSPVLLQTVRLDVKYTQSGIMRKDNYLMVLGDNIEMFEIV
jgi:hypothetical protein